MPCAHAPAFAPSLPEIQTSPKAAAEEIGYTFLPCVLAYLQNAPNLLLINKEKNSSSLDRHSNTMVAEDVDAVVVPV